MHDRARELIRELRLESHPEGGYFREIFRSPHEVKPLDERSARSALTTIYFLLLKGQHSRWHRVASDEAWHFYEGDPLVVSWIDEQNGGHDEVLAANSASSRPVCVVPAGCWQAAKPQGEYSLVGCTVGPGFDFQDFEMISPGSPELEKITGLNPAFRELA
ncbi:MAG TPA: cupin domain-containing protein [Verrucomicrobiae bacterium]|nr:cupin domain-containing protein [Verrucomicrobiae bacterium]